MMSHLYPMFSLYRKQSVDLFLPLNNLLLYDGNIVHKWLNVTNEIYLVVLYPFQNKIINVFEIQLVIWTAAILFWSRLVLKICVKITVRYIF